VGSLDHKEVNPDHTGAYAERVDWLRPIVAKDYKLTGSPYIQLIDAEVQWSTLTASMT
jgi:hypothetical protein